MFKLLVVVSKLMVDAACLVVTGVVAVAIIDHIGEKLDERDIEKRRALLKKPLVN